MRTRGPGTQSGGFSGTSVNTLPAPRAQRPPHTLPGGLSTPGPVGVFEGRESDVGEVPTDGFYRESSPDMYTHAYIHVHIAPPAAHEEAQVHPRAPV